MAQVPHTSQHSSTGQGRLALANIFTNRTLSCPNHHAFSWLAPSMCVLNMEVQQAEGAWRWQPHLQTELCPHHQVLSWLAPSMRVPYMEVQQAEGLALANAFGNRLLFSSSSPCLTCAIYVVWNSLETGPIFGAYLFLRMKGDAPSMSAFPAWSWRMSGTCAIYVPQRQFDVEEKTLGANQRRRLQKKWVIFRDMHGANYLFENGVAPSIPYMLPLT